MSIIDEYQRSSQRPSLLSGPPPAPPSPTEPALFRAPVTPPPEPAPALLRGNPPAPVNTFNATRSGIAEAASNEGSLRQRLQATQGPAPQSPEARAGDALRNAPVDDGLKTRLQATQGPQPAQPQMSARPAPAPTPSIAAAANEQATVARNKFPSAPASNPIQNPNVASKAMSADAEAFQKAGGGRALPPQVGGQPAPAPAAGNPSMANRLRGLFGLGEQGAAAAAGEAAAAVPAAAPAAAETSVIGKAAQSIGKLAGTAVRRLGPAGVGLDVIGHFNDYKLKEPTLGSLIDGGPGVDSSLGGTLSALGKGDFSMAGRSLVKGAKEAAMDLGSAAANIADYVVPGKAPVSRAYDKSMHEIFGDQLVPHPSVIAATAQAPAAAVSKPAAVAAPVVKTAAKAPAAAAPAAAAPAPAAGAPAAPASNAGAIANAARQNALDKLELEMGNDPNAIVSAARVAGRAPSEYYTADGRVIVPPAPATEADRQLSQRVAVTEAQGAPGTVFEKDGKQYANVQYGLDKGGMPVYRALSVDGQASHSNASATDLLRQYDAAQQRLGGLAPEDALSVASFHDREQRRRGIEAQYAAPAGSSGPAGQAAPAPGNRTAVQQKVAAFAEQYGPAATKAAATLGVDPSLVLAQWGQETGWGKSVIAGTHNLGNIKALKGQAGVAATDNATKSSDKYAKFGSPDEFADRYAGLLGQPRYQNVAGSGNDIGRFASALHAGGYAQDPQYVDKLKAAHATLLGAMGGGQAAAAPAAAPAPAARDPFAGAVQVVQNGQSTVHVPGGSGMTQIPQAAFDAYKGVLAKNPQLASRVTMSQQGPLVDGAQVPPEIIAAGPGKVDAYLASLTEGQNYAANPTAGKIAEEATKGDWQLKGHKVAAEAGRQRYLTVGGGVDPATMTALPTRVFDTQNSSYADAPAKPKPPLATANAQAQAALKAGASKEAVNAVLQSYNYPPIN